MIDAPKKSTISISSILPAFDFAEVIFKKRLRIVRLDASEKGRSLGTARQLDTTLLSAGFKLSSEGFDYIAKLNSSDATSLATRVVQYAKALVGDHVKHNVYFKEFPKNVPATEEFWMECILKAWQDEEIRPVLLTTLSAGYINLLDLPDYGRYLHSYEEMAQVQKPLKKNGKERVTIVNLGSTLQSEMDELYFSLAGSNAPLSEDDRELLSKLSIACLTSPQPEKIPIRENRALINAARINGSADLLVDTVTDILRLATHLSGGDVTLEKASKFKALSRPVRRTLMTSLERVVSINPEVKLADVRRYPEMWKRLGERLHPHEYSLENACFVFEVARGEKKIATLNSKIESEMAAGRVSGAITIASTAPGVLARQADRLLRHGDVSDNQWLLENFEKVMPRISGRVLLSFREHLMNRESANKRVFINRKGRAFVQDENRVPISQEVSKKLAVLIDKEIGNRIPKNFSVQPDAMHLALPLTGKNTGEGFRIMPRGSIMPVESDQVRFFCYWKQESQRTDFDLSVLFLDENFKVSGQGSYTNLKGQGFTHSGDIVDALNGASEFIDIDLKSVKAKYVVPQVNVFSGEGFDKVAESFFGFMSRDANQKGLPFEPATVTTRSDMRGSGRVALPLIFVHDDKGWSVKWMHLFQQGLSWGNATETNRVSTSTLVSSIATRHYLDVAYLANLSRKSKVKEVSTYICLDTPEKIDDKDNIISLTNLQDLLPF
jgi:hypothetical protein